MLKERGGSSLQSIRKYIKLYNNIDCHEQSFLKKSLQALQTLAATDTLEKIGHQKYKLSLKGVENRKQEARQRKKDEKEKDRIQREREWAKQKGNVGRNPWSRGFGGGDELLSGTVLENNKNARSQLIEQRARRDHVSDRSHLQSPLSMLYSFSIAVFGGENRAAETVFAREKLLLQAAGERAYFKEAGNGPSIPSLHS